VNDRPKPAKVVRASTAAAEMLLGTFLDYKKFGIEQSANGRKWLLTPESRERESCQWSDCILAKVSIGLRAKDRWFRLARCGVRDHIIDLFFIATSTDADPAWSTSDFGIE